jgi:hypothetical protein
VINPLKLIFTITVIRVYTAPSRRGQAIDMAPVLKVHEQDTAIMEKRKGKRKVDDLDEDGEGDVVPPKKKRNKQRVLLLSSRGITHRMRHLMNDLETLLPHVKKGVCVCQLRCAHYSRSCLHVGLPWLTE